jgi:hypothetical protein
MRSRRLVPVCPENARVLRKVLKIEIREFPSVFECSRVPNLVIYAHEIIFLQ